MPLSQNTMNDTKTKRAPRALPVEVAPGTTHEQALSKAALLPSINGATVIESYQGNIMGKDVGFVGLVDGLKATIKDVNSGDLSNLEAMLLTQATALQTMFTSLARRAAHQEQLKHYGVFMGLALKAQAQSRATISALVDLKYPKQATFVKQANIAHGPQQVNNGPASTGTHGGAHAEETKTDQPELLEADQHGGTNLDTGTTRTTSGADPHMAAVGAVHRPQDARRKSQSGAQR